MTTSPIQRRPLAAKLALVSTVSLGLLAGPIALAGPANAAEYPRNDNKCTVTAKKPDIVEKKRGDKDYGKAVKVVFKFKIDCDKRTHVYFDQKLFKVTKGDRAKEIKRPHSKGWVWVGRHHDVKVEVDKVFPERNKKELTVYHFVKIVYKDKGDWKRHSDESEKKTIYFRGYK
ncbi:hypothetical protein ACIP9X_21220 [Arthrobacter sp. NPDC093125]|uniref:hypothetical protein n=1 Tax=Arthrobacter sp. NPDC093125 TaxID=3363944 RepID=UPI003809E9A2